MPSASKLETVIISLDGKQIAGVDDIHRLLTREVIGKRLEERPGSGTGSLQ